MENLTNKIMYSHFAWFEKEVETSKSLEIMEDVIDQSEYTHEQTVVFNYFVKNLLHRNRKLDTISYDDVMYERGIISWQEYEKRIKGDTLVYPFKKEA